MGATSVTGVGPGSADGEHKGPGNNRNVFQPLNAAHIVAAVSGTLSGANPGVLTVTFGAVLPEASTKYTVLLTDTANGAIATNLIGVSAKSDTNSHFASFGVKGTTSHTFDWVVVRNGTV